MISTFHIPSKVLHALSLFVGHTDVRPAVKCVSFSVDSDYRLRAIGTDGMAMLVYLGERVDASLVVEPFTVSVKLTPADIKTLTGGKNQPITVTLDTDADVVRFETAGGIQRGFTTSPHALPVSNYRDIMPQRATGQAVQIHPTYHQLCDKAAKLVYGKDGTYRAHLQGGESGHDAVPVTFQDRQLLALVMPITGVRGVEFRHEDFT